MFIKIGKTQRGEKHKQGCTGMIIIGRSTRVSQMKTLNIFLSRNLLKTKGTR